MVVADAQSPQPAGAAPGVPQFEADPGWPKLPADWSWGQVIGIFADTQGHVWTSSRNRIAEWAPDGTLIQSWDARGPNGNWSTIHGLFVDHNGFVWTNARESNLTVKFTKTGQVAMVIGKFNETGGSNDTSLMGRPSDIWVDPADNEVFVADGYGNRRVIVFDGATGRYLRHWGAYGKRPEDPPAPPAASSGAAAASAPKPNDVVPAAPPAQLRIPARHRRISRRLHLRGRPRQQPDPGVPPERRVREGEDPAAALRRGGEGHVGAEAALRHRSGVLRRVLAGRAAELPLRRRRRHPCDHGASPRAISKW